MQMRMSPSVSSTIPPEVVCTCWWQSTIADSARRRAQRPMRTDSGGGATGSRRQNRGGSADAYQTPTATRPSISWKRRFKDQANRRPSFPPPGRTSPSRTPDGISTIVAQAAGSRPARKLIGHKVGLTSKAMQRSSNIDEPDFGYLLDDMMIPDGAQGAARGLLPAAGRDRARLRARQEADRGRASALTDVLRATEYVVPSLETGRRAAAGPAQDFRHRVGQRRGRPASCSAAGRCGRWTSICAGSAASCTSIRRDRGDRRRRRRARPSGDGRRVAGEPARHARYADGAGPRGAGRARSRAWCFPKKGDTLHADFGQLGGISMQYV